MQPGGWDRSHKDFLVERQGMMWDIDVRVGGVVEGESFLPSIPGEGEGMGAMWGGAFGGDEMPLVDSAGGAGWAEGQLGVAGFAVEVQNGRGGVARGEQGGWAWSADFSGGFCEPGPRLQLSGFKWRCLDCDVINPVEFYG